MDAKTLAALKARIEKWRANTKVENFNDAKIFGDTCPLCAIYWDNKDEDEKCAGCPVSEKAGDIGCYNSPWHDAYRHYDLWADQERFETRGTAARDFRAAAQVEVDFLISLLPEGETA